MTAPGHIPPPAPGWWVKRNRVAFPPACIMVLTGFAPIVRTTFMLTPAAASMTLTGFAPAILSGTVVTPAAASMTLTGFAPVVSQAPVPLSIVGTPGAANADNITLPTHAVGDDIYIFAFRGNSTTLPSVPGAAGTVPAWGDIDAPAGSNGCSARTAHFVATATNHTSGVWANATSMAVIVLRGANGIGGHALSGGAAINQAVAPAATLTQADGSSMILEFYGQTGSSTVGDWDAAPTGYTRRAATSQTTASTRSCLNTKTVTTTDGSVTQTGTTGSFSTGYQGATIEVLD